MASIWKDDSSSVNSQLNDIQRNKLSIITIIFSFETLLVFEENIRMFTSFQVETLFNNFPINSNNSFIPTNTPTYDLIKIF